MLAFSQKPRNQREIEGLRNEHKRRGFAAVIVRYNGIMAFFEILIYLCPSCHAYIKVTRLMVVRQISQYVATSDAHIVKLMSRLTRSCQRSPIGNVKVTGPDAVGRHIPLASCMAQINVI